MRGLLFDDRGIAEPVLKIIFKGCFDGYEGPICVPRDGIQNYGMKSGGLTLAHWVRDAA